MQTVRQALENKLRESEKQVAQLRGKLARLEQRAPELLDVKAKQVSVFAYSRDVKITIADRYHEQPKLPSLLLSLSNSKLATKETYGEDMEYFSFSIANITVDLDRKLRMMKKCRKARVEQVIDICGEPGADVEVIEWIEE